MGFKNKLFKGAEDFQIVYYPGAIKFVHGRTEEQTEVLNQLRDQGVLDYETNLELAKLVHKASNINTKIFNLMEELLTISQTEYHWVIEKEKSRSTITFQKVSVNG